MKAAIAVLAFLAVVPAQAQSPNCWVDGVSAICRSPSVERQTKAIVLHGCKRCDPSEVGDWIYSLQMNRGPYASAEELARDVRQQVRAR